MQPRRVFVIGAGAIGASVGALLFETGVDCVLVVRGTEHGRAIAERGVDLRFPTTARVIRVPTATTATATSDDLVLLATMGHETDAALEGIGSDVTIASFQNGVTPLDAIRRHGHETLAAMVYVPAERRGPGVIALPGAPVAGTVIVGEWPSGEGRFTQWLTDRLRAAGFRSEATDDIAPWVRAKLLVNLGGIVAALCDDSPEDVTEAARAEARAVWRGMGERFEDIATLVPRMGELWIAPVEGHRRMGGSTRSALSRGDRLETESLHGPIIEAGRACSIPTPVNERLVALAAEATEKQWPPGAMTAEGLRRRVFV